MHIAHRIVYIGWIDEEMRKEIFANTLLNVLPSYNEGLPMTVLETMAYGIPNISTNIASIPEVLHDGENAFLIAPGDVELLVLYIKRLVENDEMRRLFSEKSYRLISEKFSLNYNIEQLKGIYVKILQ